MKKVAAVLGLLVCASLAQGQGCVGRAGGGCMGSVYSTGCQGYSVGYVVSGSCYGGCAGRSGGGCMGSYGAGCIGSSGCMGSYGGCTGRAGGGCYGSGCYGSGCMGTTYGSGCSGSGCYGSGCMGTTYGSGCSGGTAMMLVPVPVAASRPSGSMAYASGVPYGTRLGGGQWATPSGNPPPPEIFGIAGAKFPLDGPIRRAKRAFWGYDAGP